MEIGKLKSPPRKSFADAVKEFSQSGVSATASDFFVWMEIADEEDFNEVLRRYSTPTKEKSGQRKLDWKKVRRRLL
jgi:predicted peroxiredoxin